MHRKNLREKLERYNPTNMTEMIYIEIRSKKKRFLNGNKGNNLQDGFALS
jgi:hypothetical protein